MYKLIEFLRRIYVAVLFVVFEAIAIGYYAHSSNYTQAKLLTRSNQVVGGVNGIFADIRSYFTLGRENERLLERVAVLEEELAFYRRSAADSVRTDLLHDMGEKPYELTVARVISNSINKNRNFIVLDRGERDGVEKGMGVLSPEGAMVGYVAASSDRHAVAVSILNTSFNASGKLAGDDYFGSIYWAGDDRYHVRMKELSKYARVTEGEEVVSSGFSQYFPADVLIGYVESFSLADTQMAYDVVIRLAVDVSQLTDVILVRNRDIEDVQELEAEAERPKQKINNVPDCSLYRLIPYFGPVADFSVRTTLSYQYLPLPFGLYSASLSCCRSTLRRLQCFFWLCRCPLRWIGRWGQRGSIRSLRFRSLCCAGRFCSLSAVRRGFGRVVFLLRSGWGRADFCATWQRWSWYTTSCFFMLESLSWAQLFHTLVRLVVSSAVTVGFIWLLARLFTTKLTVRL